MADLLNPWFLAAMSFAPCQTGMDHLQQIEAFLHSQIPITRAMGVRVEVAEPTELVLTAPLALNHNHLGTAFGGSLAAVATLAGYAFLWLALEDQAAHVVVAESSLVYRRPVEGDIRAICRHPDQALVSSFRAGYAQKGKARITLDVMVEHRGELAVSFTGTFVAKRGM